MSQAIWQVKDKKLYFEKTYTAGQSITKARIADALQKMYEQIGRLSCGIQIKLVRIDRWTATALFQGGELTEAMLTNAQQQGTTLILNMNFGGATFPVHITKELYLAGPFAFEVTGHPKGKKFVANLNDLIM